MATQYTNVHFEPTFIGLFNAEQPIIPLIFKANHQDQPEDVILWLSGRAFEQLKEVIAKAEASFDEGHNTTLVLGAAQKSAEAV